MRMDHRTLPCRPMNAAAAQIEPTLRTHQRHLRVLCYRMTGSAADADDLVQETFARALSRPAESVAAPKAWLTQVAMNLARDLLRKRRRMEHATPWPPETAVEVGGEAPTPEQRYHLMESASFALLLALETLSARQRAVLLLREVLEYSVRETAVALGISENNVRRIHLRARRAIDAREPAGTAPTRSMQGRQRALLRRLAGASRTHG